MLQSLEIALIEAVIAFYRLGPVVGLVFFGVPGVSCLIYKFTNRESTIIPAIGSAIFFILAFLHVFAGEMVATHLYGLITQLSTPHSPHTVFLFEPIFSLFVAPADHRYIYEEILFVLFLGYITSFCIIGYREYKKTGILIGDISIINYINKAKARPERSKSNELGSADLANTEEITRWTRERTDYTHSPPYTLLNVEELKGSEGIALKSGQLMIPQGERNRHMLMIAKTGGGKTSKFILPILYDDCLCPIRSTIVLDSKPEMWGKLANFTRKYNPEKELLLFNPLDTLRSLSWNILSKIENDTDAKLIANTIIMATDNPSAKSDSPFFRNNALQILNGLMVGLLSDKEETLSMPRIHQLVQSGMKELANWIEAHPEALRTTKTFVELARSGSQNADTIMSELGMRLAAWDLKAIRSTTWLDELNPETLVEKPTLMVVELRESELEMLRPMANVIVVELLRYLTKRAESCPGHKLPRPVGFVIDEFASALGRLPDIHVKLNTLRSRNVSIVAAIQSIAQVKANYGDDADSVLAGFSTKIFLPPLDLQDAEWASKETGQMTIRFQTKSTGSNKKKIEFFASQNDGTQEQVQQRAVLTPDEIGRPPDKITTFFLPETPPFQGHIKFYFKIPEMLNRIKESEDADELKLREGPIEIEEAIPQASPAQQTAGGGGGAAAAGPPTGITDTKGWNDDQVREKLEEVKKVLDWENTTGSSKKWWEAFENENKHRL
ncbi:MAG: type IV secretory system conjugative DNA transfer family protein, partial [Bdellovibrionales bacterium]|nr:type IV secretory system conjugative DNA transfer family protein [Bdellovibrionales bacterium]